MLMDWLPKIWPAIVVSPHSGKTFLDIDISSKQAGLSLLLGTQWDGLWLSYAGTGPTVLAISPAPSLSVLVSIVILFLHPNLCEHTPTLWMHARTQTHSFQLCYFCLCTLMPRLSSHFTYGFKFCVFLDSFLMPWFYIVFIYSFGQRITIVYFLVILTFVTLLWELLDPSYCIHGGA